MRKAALAIVCSFSFIAHAQCPPASSLFFGNGMFNSEESANESLVQLSSKLQETENWKQERSYLAYNYDETAVHQLLEVFEQKLGDFDKQFWSWLWDWTNAPTWFRNAVQILQNERELSGFQAYSLTEQQRRYQNEMELGRSIVVVAHSQGNFFANNASLLLQNAFYPASTDFRIISVATPSSFVNDDGPYFTLKSDGVIRWIPGALPPNIENISPEPGLFDHRFVDHYLEGSPTGQKIVERIQTIFHLLANQSKESDGYNAECWSWFESLNLPIQNQDECVLKCGTAKKDFSNFMCNQCEAYCQCSRKLSKDP